MIAAKIKATQGIEGARRATEIPWSGAAKEKETVSHPVLTATPPDPEVSEKARRRRFTAEYKLRILKQADAFTEAGSLGALLRREGLYSSNLTTWRHQRDRGALSALTPRKRGRKELVLDPHKAENETLRKENDRLTNRLRQAEIIIDVQKKISAILGIPVATPENGENE
jgi:transposase-like protein